jgi:beta-glucanase (GH16 family)
MSTTPSRQHAHGTLPALLVLFTLLSVLLVALGRPTPARAADDDASRHRGGEQSTSIDVLPPIRQPGPGEAPSSAAQTVVTATLSPAQEGRPVVLERRTGHGWRPMTTVLTDADGRAEFFVPTRLGGVGTYRAVAQSYRGRVSQRSSAVAATTWGAPDFVDEFDGSSLGPAWENRIQFYNPWGGRACSKGSPAAVVESGGALQLSSMPDPAVTDLCTATDVDGNVLGQYPYRLNGHISTQNSADFLYGVAAARMKFQRDPGAHAAFWMQPRGLLDTGPTSWGAEVDVVEWYGTLNRRSRMASAVHAPTPTGQKIQFGGAVHKPDRFLAGRADAWWSNYHVFSVEWTPTEYIFRIDSHEVWRTDQGVSHDPEFLILSMLSSDFELPQLGARQALTQTASVDWVKFWQAK